MAAHTTVATGATVSAVTTGHTVLAGCGRVGALDPDATGAAVAALTPRTAVTPSSYQPAASATVTSVTSLTAGRTIRSRIPGLKSVDTELTFDTGSAGTTLTTSAKQRKPSRAATVTAIAAHPAGV